MGWTVGGNIAGSAPRARGTGALATEALRLQRLSPACAGNGAPHRRARSTMPAQPRVRGERGPLGVDDHADLRLSPACAGNGASAVFAHQLLTAQPRVRGERHGGTAKRRLVGGSAPRARGTGSPYRIGLESGRLSPACAGNGES